jgi:hypothetical protein
VVLGFCGDFYYPSQSTFKTFQYGHSVCNHCSMNDQSSWNGSEGIVLGLSVLTSSITHWFSQTNYDAHQPTYLVYCK